MRVPDIDEEFKRELVDLVPTLLSPENLVEKEIGGVKITCRELLHYFKVSLLPFQPRVLYVKLFSEPRAGCFHRLAKVISQERLQGLSSNFVRPSQVKGRCHCWLKFCGHNISRTLGGIFGTNLHLDHRVKMLNFGGPRSL